MKTFSVVINFAWGLVALVGLVALLNQKEADLVGICVLALAVLSCGLNVWILFHCGSLPAGWVSLFLRRKRLEEQRKIDALTQRP